VRREAHAPMIRLNSGMRMSARKDWPPRWRTRRKGVTSATGAVRTASIHPMRRLWTSQLTEAVTVATSGAGPGADAPPDQDADRHKQQARRVQQLAGAEECHVEGHSP
jgi:hypothetical protein